METKKIIDVDDGHLQLGFAKFQPWPNLKANEEQASKPLTFMGSFQDSALNVLPFFLKGSATRISFSPCEPGCPPQPASRNIYECPFLFHPFLSFNRFCHFSPMPLALLLGMAKQINKMESFPRKIKHMFFIIPSPLTRHGPGKQSWCQEVLCH